MTNAYTVLIAEDDPVFRRVMTFSLERSNYRVEAAGDGNSAYDRLIEGGIDFLVTDQQMPLCTGIELLERKQQNPEVAGVPAILCTAKGFELDSCQLEKQYGLIDVMHKPFSPRKLAELITEHLAKMDVVSHG